MPTPNTSELFRVVTSDALGAPEAALRLPTAPIAPEPFVPEVSTPVKLTTVIDAATERDNVAVTVAFVSVAGANARQISDVPACALARVTRVHTSPPPATAVTVVLPVAAPSVATNASRSSLPAAVEKAGLAIVVLDDERPVVLLTSTAIAAEATVEDNPTRVTASAARRRFVIFMNLY